MVSLQSVRQDASTTCTLINDVNQLPKFWLPKLLLTDLVIGDQKSMLGLFSVRLFSRQLIFAPGELNVCNMYTFLILYLKENKYSNTWCYLKSEKQGKPLNNTETRSYFHFVYSTPIYDKLALIKLIGQKGKCSTPGTSFIVWALRFPLCTQFGYYFCSSLLARK